MERWRNLVKRLRGNDVSVHRRVSTQGHIYMSFRHAHPVSAVASAPSAVAFVDASMPTAVTSTLTTCTSMPLPLYGRPGDDDPQRRHGGGLLQRLLRAGHAGVDVRLQGLELLRLLRAPLGEAHADDAPRPHGDLPHVAALQQAALVQHDVEVGVLGAQAGRQLRQRREAAPTRVHGDAQCRVGRRHC